MFLARYQCLMEAASPSWHTSDHETQLFSMNLVPDDQLGHIFSSARKYTII